MDEQSAEIFAARLTRIWTPLWESSGRELTIVWEQDKPPRFRWSCSDGRGMEVRVVAKSGTMRVFFQQGNLGLQWKGKSIESTSRYDTQHEAMTTVVNQFYPSHPQTAQEFVAQWKPVFRRNCWLSGCKVIANVVEHEEWIQDFTAEEISLWNLDREIAAKLAIEKAIEAQLPRVVAAFGVEQWDEIERNSDDAIFRSNLRDKWFVCSFDANGEIDFLSLHSREEGATRLDCDVDRFDGNWHISGLQSQYIEQLARGLYCLGFENEEVFAKLPPLSAHERLELRLSLPREFWPQKWLDEAING